MASADGDRVMSGIAPLDEAVGGLAPGELLVLAGRPQMGASELALSMALGAAASGVAVLWMGGEWHPAQLGVRLLCAEAKVCLDRVRRGVLRGADLERLREARQLLGALPISMGSVADVSPDIGLVVWDRPDLEGRMMVGQYAVARWVAGQCPVIVTLGIAPVAPGEFGGDVRPYMSSVDVSFASADAVLLVHRPEFYNPDTRDQGVTHVTGRVGRCGARCMLRDFPEWGGFAPLPRADR